MGYYSDVALCMHKSDFVDMLQYFKKHESEAYDTWSRADRYETFYNHSDPSNPIITAYIDYTKWYEDFDDVMYTDKYLSIMEDKDLDFRFVRVGEEQGDFEERTASGSALWEYCEIKITIDSYCSPDSTGSYEQIFGSSETINIEEII